MQKTNKVINVQSLRPTSKPSFNKSTIIQRNNTQNMSSNQKLRYFFNDVINKTSISDTNLIKQKQIFHQEGDLVSSFSYSEGDQEYQVQRQVFSQFLMSKSQDWISYIKKMMENHNKQLVKIVKIGSEEAQIYQNRIISHYIGVWLISMGYKDNQTRGKVVVNVRFIYPQLQGVQIVVMKLYDSLFHGYLSEALQIRVLIQICKKGWEYLSFFIGKFIKIIPKYKYLNDKQFLKEIQSSI